MSTKYFMSRNRAMGGGVVHACHATGQGASAILTTYCGRKVINPTPQRQDVELCDCEKCLKKISEERERSEPR